MSKRLTRTLFLSAMGSEIIAILFAIFNYTMSINNPNTVSVALTIGLLAFITQVITWTSALIKTASLQRWGWFITLLVGGGISMLFYIFAGPETTPRTLT